MPPGAAPAAAVDVVVRRPADGYLAPRGGDRRRGYKDRVVRVTAGVVVLVGVVGDVQVVMALVASEAG